MLKPSNSRERKEISGPSNGPGPDISGLDCPGLEDYRDQALKEAEKAGDRAKKAKETADELKPLRHSADNMYEARKHDARAVEIAKGALKNDPDLLGGKSLPDTAYDLERAFREAKETAKGQARKAAREAMRAKEKARNKCRE